MTLLISDFYSIFLIHNFEELCEYTSEKITKIPNKNHEIDSPEICKQNISRQEKRSHYCYDDQYQLIRRPKIREVRATKLRSRVWRP